MENSLSLTEPDDFPTLSPTPEAGLRVLVVDDSPADRDYYTRLLRDEGFLVTTAGSAPECFSILEREPVQCVLLDYNLPRTHGIDVLTDIVADPLQRKIPVIMLTGEGSQNVAVEALKSGAADYLLKDDITASALRRSIENAFEKGCLREAVKSKASQLEAMNKSLRKRNDEIRRFYHTISHEIKTPLAAAREFVSLIQDGVAGPVTNEQDDLLALCIECCDQLAMHLNNLIDSTRLDSGKLTIESAPFEVSAVVRKAVASVSSFARDRNVEIETNITDDVSRAIGDGNRITQVLCNLLSNAIKSSSQGQRVAVTAERSGDKAVFAVSDHGCGIEDAHITQIFDRLFQVPVEETNGGGLGLGLSISQELIRLHGSTISVVSELDRGSTFAFELSVP